jgi:hypothetical protein
MSSWISGAKWSRFDLRQARPADLPEPGQLGVVVDRAGAD